MTDGAEKNSPIMPKNHSLSPLSLSSIFLPVAIKQIRQRPLRKNVFVEKKFLLSSGLFIAAEEDNDKHPCSV